ncbi:MAG: RDD family protein [Candidatus Omnitrophica bacterium]|nr:RDD family protein [Candidatus Omnitrophota bacterium]
MVRKSQFDNKELNAILEAEREAIFSMASQESQPGSEGNGEGMVAFPTPERLDRFPHPISIHGLDAPLGIRIKSRLIDYVIVGVPLFLMDGLFHLTRLARFFFGDLHLPEDIYGSPVLLSPGAWKALLDHPYALSRVLLFVFSFLLLYRLIFYWFVRRTLGHLITGVMLTTENGRFPGTGSRLFKAVTSTLADMTFVGILVDVLLYAISSPKATTSDSVAGIRAVRYDDWARLTSRLLDRMNTLRRDGLNN